MAITRGELKGQILRFLNKTGGYTGFYGDDKLDDSIQEALDFIATEMFLAGEGWNNKLYHFDTVAGQVSIELPGSLAMIKEVRVLFGDAYIPMTYNDGTDQARYSDSSGVQQFGCQYSIMDNALYFNPALGEGGAKYIQVECVNYPRIVQDDNEIVDTQFDRAMQHYIKYKTASILSASAEKMSRPWADIENDWYKKMLAVVNRRNMKFTRIRSFGD